MGKLNICIDIDGVLCVETFGNKEYINREPIAENIDKCNKLSRIHWVTLYTARDRIHKHETELWLKKHKVKYHDILFGKPKFDVLIDDKAFNSFGDFEKFGLKKQVYFPISYPQGD